MLQCNKTLTSYDKVWKLIYGFEYILTFNSQSIEKQNVVITKVNLVDPIEDEGHTGHEGRLEDGRVPRPALHDHRRLVRQGVGAAVSDPGRRDYMVHGKDVETF